MLSSSPELWLIPALPMLGALIIFLFGRYMRPRTAGIIACVAAGLCCMTVLTFGSLLIAWGPETMVFFQRLWQWLDAGTIQASIGFYFDRLALVFCIIVSGVGFLIHIYSLSYMHGDEGERRYFGYLNLFLAAMLVLVMADNGFFMFMGWEGVGACSFLLIGHWYQKSENAAAAQKAFLVTRIGDIFLILGLLLCARLGGVDFLSLYDYERLSHDTVNTIWGVPNATLVLIAALLLLGGAIGKSAQLPLQVWLPDAMAGPTPVSALIHAATMVTAGVYLVARFHVLYSSAPTVMAAVAVVGLLTAFYGATCAIVQTDIKRILAYSTISQIGYMILGLGVGAFALGVFHFFTHAFYKALLFMAAGAVIHALHNEQNIYRMGGLKDGPLRGTFLTFLAGAASLAGVPLITAGFFSKDAIIWASLTTPYGAWFFYAIALGTAFLTSVYSFRLIFVVFFGRARTEQHVHAPDAIMMIPLYVLAVFALIAGYLNIPAAWGVPAVFERFFEPVFGHSQAHPAESFHRWEIPASILSAVVALGGVGIAWLLYGPNKRVIPATAMPEGDIQIATPVPYRSRLATLVYHGWGFDLVYEIVFVSTFRRVSSLAAWVDRVIIDGLYDLAAAIVRGLHAVVLVFQNGRIPRYALVMLVGAVAITSILLTFYARGG